MDKRREQMYEFMAATIRVLAGVEDLAKRIEEHRREIEALRAAIDHDTVGRGELIEFLRARLDDEAEDALKQLALPYADHPDYQEEWRP